MFQLWLILFNLFLCLQFIVSSFNKFSTVFRFILIKGSYDVWDLHIVKSVFLKDYLAVTETFRRRSKSLLFRLP